MTTKELSAMVESWRQSGSLPGALQGIVRAWCATATADGIAYERQLAILESCGIRIGPGGPGPDPMTGSCPYCGAYGGGGHGGLCPHGSGGLQGEQPQPGVIPDWLADVAADVASVARVTLAHAMRLHNEFPVDQRSWRARWGQLRDLLLLARPDQPRHAGAPQVPDVQWRALEHLLYAGPDHRTVRRTAEGIGEPGLVVFAALDDAEQRGLVRKAEVTGDRPTVWELTAAGRGALAGRRRRD